GLPAPQWARAAEPPNAGPAGRVGPHRSPLDAGPAPPAPAPPRLHPTCPDLTRTHLACPCPAPSAPTSCRGRGLSSYTAFRSRQRQEVRSRPKDFTMYTDLKDQLTAELTEIEEAGTFKHERVITTPPSGRVMAGPVGRDGTEVLNFCANNYLGLADHPDIVSAAKQALDERGFGMASVRFICGTQDLHLRLEQAVTDFLGTEDTILFSSCFDATGAVFGPLFDAEDATISDELNHASLIDGIRLSKAARFRYRNADLEDLRAQLEAVAALRDGKGARRTVIVTDGVFSMDGYLAPLEGICD